MWVKRDPIQRSALPVCDLPESSSSMIDWYPTGFAEALDSDRLAALSDMANAWSLGQLSRRHRFASRIATL